MGSKEQGKFHLVDPFHVIWMHVMGKVRGAVTASGALVTSGQAQSRIGDIMQFLVDGLTV